MKLSFCRDSRERSTIYLQYQSSCRPTCASPKTFLPLFKKRNVYWHKYCLKDLPGRRFIYMPVLCPAGLPALRRHSEWCNDMQSLEMIKMWQALFSTEAPLIRCVCRHRRSSRQPYSGILYFVFLPVNWKEENDKARIYSFDHRETTCSPHLEKLQLGYFLRWGAGISKSFWPPLFCSAAHHSTPPACCYNNMEVVYFKRRRRRWRRRFPLLIKNAENWIRKSATMQFFMPSLLQQVCILNAVKNDMNYKWRKD